MPFLLHAVIWHNTSTTSQLPTLQQRHSMQRTRDGVSVQSHWHLGDMPLRESPALSLADDAFDAAIAAEFIPQRPGQWDIAGSYLLAVLLHRVGEHERTDVSTVELYLGAVTEQLKVRQFVRKAAREDAAPLVSKIDALLGPWALLCASSLCCFWPWNCSAVLAQGSELCFLLCDTHSVAPTPAAFPIKRSARGCLRAAVSMRPVPLAYP
jgi:hypothetical protein